MKKRILFIITKSVLGGAQKYVSLLVNGLPKNRYVITVAAAPGGWLEDFVRFNKIEFIPVNSFSNKSIRKHDIIDTLFDLRAYFELYKIIKNRSFDIVHTNSTKAGIVGRVVAKLNKISLVIHTTHGLNLFEDLSWKKWMMIYFAEKLLGYFTDIFIAVCDKDKNALEKYRIAFSNKIVRIYNGVDSTTILTKKACVTCDQKLKLLNDNIIIGTLSNYSHNKGLSYLIEAANTVINCNHSIHFVICGDYNNKIANEIKNKYESCKNIHFIGIRYELNYFMPFLDIFVLTSVKEGAPFALIEAMAYELPIVTTNVGGITEIIKNGESGLVVLPKCPDSIAKAIIELINNNELAKKLARNARIRQEQLFTSERMIKSTTRVYDMCDFGH